MLHAPTFEDLARNRIAGLQHKILLAMIAACLLTSITLLFTWSDYQTRVSVELLFFAMLMFILAFILMHRGYIQFVSWILVGVVYLIFLLSFSAFGYSNTNAIELVLTIALASLLLRHGSAGIVAVIAAVSPLGLHFIAPSFPVDQHELVFITLVIGLSGLVLTVGTLALEQSFAEVDRSQQGILQANKNLQNLSMQLAIRTETLIAEVENRNAAKRTILRQNQLLTAAAEIASAATSTLDLDKLLLIAVELIQEKFSFYHASVFLIEPGSDIAVLRASAGQGGNRLPVNQHRLTVGSKSLVGTATATRQPVVVMDVTNNPTHLKNPLLPYTQSEAVIPLMVGELTNGALDVQSTLINGFSDWDITILTTISNQLAIAVQNARLYASMQEEITERRRAEQELQFANEGLEIRVNERTAELAQSISTLHATLEATADGILVVDEGGKIVNFNRRFTEMWHIPVSVMEPRKTSGW